MKHSHVFKQTAFKRFPQGDFYRASSKNFPALKGLAIQALDLAPGAIREPHTHPNANQLDYCVSGHGRVGIVGPDSEVHLLDLTPGDISFVPQGFLHWIENTGDKPLSFLVVLSHEEPQTIELSEMIKGVPNEALGRMYGIDQKVFDAIPQRTVTIGGPNALDPHESGEKQLPSTLIAAE